MIADKISNIAFYPMLADVAQDVLDFIARIDAEKLEAGRYELRGTDLFALLQNNTTKAKENGRMESHEKYADLQYIHTGREVIYYDTLDDQVITEDTRPAKDNIFYASRPDKGGIVLSSGMFGYYAPQDCHMPGISVEGPESVTKVVFKIRMK